MHNTSRWRSSLRPIGLLGLVLAAVAVAACQRPVVEGPAVAVPTRSATLAATPTTLLDRSSPTKPTAASLATATLAPTAPETPSPSQEATAPPESSPEPTLAPSIVPTTTVAGAEVVDSYRVVAVYPHDRTAFTEGLVYVDGVLYEGTGLDNQSNPPGQSVLEKKVLETGQVLQGIVLAPEYFGEGVTVLDDRVYQLTWRERTGFVYDKETLQPLGAFALSSDGWGLTHDGERLIRSDGTNSLIFLDPVSLQETGRVEVLDGQGNPVINLNELEYIDGEVLANVWLTDTIVRIDPATGRVLGWIDLTGLLSPEDRTQRVDVLNGIAYDADQDRLFVTGKWWPKLFEIDVVPAGAP